MEKIKDKINNKFKKFINKDMHPFFNDLNRVNKITNNFRNYQKNTSLNKIEYNKNINVSDVKVKKNVKDILTIEDLKKLNSELKNNTNYFKIFKIVTNISKYYLKDNEITKNNFDKNKDSVLVIGAGPIGLFLSCYLKLTYQLNVILIDNRINKPGFRKPYTRVRPFSTSSKYLSLILPKIYCMGKNNYLNLINIFVLEYLLYSQAVLEYDIIMLYRDYDWNDYTDIMKKYDINFVFDCTGGRLKTNIFNNIDSSWIKNKINKDLGKQLMIIDKKNIVHLVDYPEIQKFKLNHFYCSINIYDNNMQYIEKIEIDIMSEKDLIYLNKHKKKYYNFKNIIKVISGIHDNIGRNYCYDSIKPYESMKDNLFEIDIWSIYIRHIIQPSEVFTINKKERLYIAVGDSMFHSHFIIGAGLNRTIKFAVYAANQLNYLY